MQAGQSYVPASRKTLTRLVPEVRATVEAKLGSMHATIKHTASAFCSDGFSDINNVPLVNVLRITPLGCEFLMAEDTEGKSKTAEYLAGEKHRHT